jgi:hypothetical protein
MMRGLINVVIIGIFLFGGIAVAVLRPTALEGVLPTAAVDFLKTLNAGSGLGADPSRKGDTPADLLDDSPSGLLAMGPIAAHSGNLPVFIADAITGYKTQVSADIPAEITTIRPILGCIPTPPQPGTVVGHATSGASDLRLALSTYNDTHLASAVQAFVDAYRADGEAATVEGSGPAYEAYDVAITETGAPVYLVLENRTGNRIWNLHLAPGARIERVVLLGGDQAGVANLDPVVPVEVILNDGMATCGLQPAYALNSGNEVFQSMQNGTVSGDEAEVQLAELRAAVDAYDIWFRDSFGVMAGQSRVGFDKGTVSVIGPLPDATNPMAAYAPIAGARIRTTQDQFFEIRGQVAEGQVFAARVRAIATGFAFGDLAGLRQGVDF